MSDSKVADLAMELGGLQKKKVRLHKELVEVDRRERAIASELNSLLGLVPIEEAAKKVKRVMEHMGRIMAKERSAAMKRVWESKTPEERADWKRHIQEGRLAKKEATQ